MSLPHPHFCSSSLLAPAGFQLVLSAGLHRSLIGLLLILRIWRFETAGRPVCLLSKPPGDRFVYFFSGQLIRPELPFTCNEVG